METWGKCQAYEQVFDWQTDLRWLKTSTFDETWQEPNPSQPFYWTYWRRTVLWKSSPKVAQKRSLFFPQVRGKLASRGDNVYVLDFKHFPPVRKSRCKGMFFCLQDLTDSFLLFFFFSIFKYFPLGVVMEWQSLALHRLNTRRMSELNMHCRSLPNVLLGFLLQRIILAKCIFLLPQPP